MIFPTLKIQVLKHVGNDAYAQPKYAPAKVERVCPVKLDFMQRPTSVRTDAAASKSRAMEDNAAVVILALPKTSIALSDKLVILGNSLRVMDMHPRFTVDGKLDHYEVKCVAWT